MPGFLEIAGERVVIFDGAMGTQLQARNLTVDDFRGQEGFNEILCLSRPDVIRDIHAAYFDAGADVVETNSFGAFEVVLAEYDAIDKAFELNEAAARLAREVASSYEDKPRFVSGSIGPGTKLPTLGQISFAHLADAYSIQVEGLLAGGADLLQIETCQDLLQAKAAIVGAQQAFAKAGRSVPVIVQVTIETTGTMLLGTEIGAALVALEPYDIAFIGLNCATGPEEMAEHLRVLSAQSPKMISVLPNAGLPEIRADGPYYPLTPEQFVEHHRFFVEELGVNAIGGCCGTTPEYIRQLVNALGGAVPARRRPVLEPSVASLYSPVTLAQETSFLVIGERTNANGSKKFRELMLGGDWSGCIQVAKDQIREGAHLLDVCVDYVGRDGRTDMDELAGKLATQSTIPLVIDSTEPAVIEAALAHIGGRAVINSVNLEDGERKLELLCPLARRFGAACVALLIDEEGQARDVEWKMRVAHRIHDLVVGKYGLRSEDLIFDALTFPLSSGQEELRRDGLNTLEAIRRIKAELPGVFTVLGVSNCSFGLKPAARQVLNSVFLHEAVDAGLDAAIVNAAKILPLNKIPDSERQLALDLIYDRRRDGYDPLTELIEVFEDATERGGGTEDRSSWPVERRLTQRVIDGDKAGLEADLDEALATHDPLEIVNDILLEGMKTVGDLFGRGEMQLPFVLQSAECMKSAVGHLEPHMERAGGRHKGRVVLATVRGDVHDIGKNLVDIILSNNGYDTVNLGIKVPISEVIQAMHTFEADAIGLSGLLVKSTQVMKEDLEELNRQGLSDWPVILGGAALTRSFVEGDLRKVYEGRVFYGKDAFEGLQVIEEIVEGSPEEGFGREPVDRKAALRAGAGQAGGDASSARRAGDSRPSRSGVRTTNEVPKPPFLGSQVVKGIPLDDIVPYLNETALFRNQWQYRPGAGGPDEFNELIENEARPALREWLNRSKEEQLFLPQAVYGYWAAQSSGDDLIVYDFDGDSEAARFSFPRQKEDPFLCISDFFRPVASGETDYVAFHLVTIGPRSTEKAHELFEADSYQDYLHVHGVSVELAEALAEYWHKRIRQEWGIAGSDAESPKGLFRKQYRGCRYSFGYPACPDLEDQVKLVKLLKPERIGVELSEEFQLHPEQSTSAIICHHPEAGYFVVR